MTPTGIEVLDKYATAFTVQLSKAGFDVDGDEIANELWFAYDLCQKNYNPKNDAEASFETYVIKSFQRELSRIAKELGENTKRFVPIEIAEIELSDEMSAEHDTLNMLIADDQRKQVMKAITDGRKLVIFNEMVSPSHKVVEVMAALRYHRVKTKSNGAFVTAVALVYGYTYDNVRHHVYGIRKIAKKVLTN